MQTDPDIWNRLCEILEPATVSEKNIQRIIAFPNKGTLTVKTVVPSAFDTTQQQEPSEGIFEQDETGFSLPDSELEVETNKELSIHEYPAPTLLNALYKAQENAVVSTSRFCSIKPDKPRAMSITEEQTDFLFQISSSYPERHELFDRLADVFEEMGYIEAPDELASGTVNQFYHTDESHIGQEGWETDGTAYRYTDEPYEYWNGSEKPRDIDEWVEFASETEAKAELIRSRDTHRIHFHPSKWGLREDHPLVEYMHEAERILKRDVSTQSGDIHLAELQTTPYKTTIKGVLECS